MSKQFLQEEEHQDFHSLCLIFLLCVLLQLLPIHTLRLGMEVDSFNGHHYISSIVSGGPLDKLGLFQLEDELLEVKCEDERGRGHWA